MTIALHHSPEALPRRPRGGGGGFLTFPFAPSDLCAEGALLLLPQALFLLALAGGAAVGAADAGAVAAVLLPPLLLPGRRSRCLLWGLLLPLPVVLVL